MRQLRSYEDLEQAQGLSDHLEARGIENQIRSNPGGHGVWIIREDDLASAREIATGYTGGSSRSSRAEARRIRKKRREDARPVRIPGPSRNGALARGGPVGQATLALIVLSVAVAVLSGLGDLKSPVVRALLIVPISPEGYYFGRIDWSEPWRLLTPMLIHFGILHLAFNMLWLYRLGSQIENLHGLVPFLGLVALTQIPGALAQFSVSGPTFGGMSGVVYGLFGFTWMQARYDPARRYGLSDQDTLIIMGWFVLCATGLVGHIANVQHALGLVFGLVAGMPAYVAYRRSSATVRFDEGSWADLNIRGFQRFRRLYFEPYVPLWFVALAIAVLLVG